MDVACCRWLLNLTFGKPAVSRPDSCLEPLRRSFPISPGLASPLMKVRERVTTGGTGIWRLTIQLILQGHTSEGTLDLTSSHTEAPCITSMRTACSRLVWLRVPSPPAILFLSTLPSKSNIERSGIPVLLHAGPPRGDQDGAAEARISDSL